MLQGIRTLSGAEATPDSHHDVDAYEQIVDATDTTISHLKGSERIVTADELQGKAWTLSDLQVG